MRVIDPKPVIKSIEKSQKYVSDQGVTYNQAVYTYNQSGVTYGGLYGVDGPKPR
jgi:hypothetical protein